jgi:GT2 family glycosyltransferase
MTQACTGLISVIVLTYNRRESLRQVLGRLTSMAERAPVIVVDNGSTDGTASMVREDFPGVELIRSRENLGAAGRNLGAAWAITPFIAFCDDDCWWQPGSLSLACELFVSYPHVASLTARIVVGETNREDPASAEMAASPLASDGLPGSAILGLMAGATAFRRHAFLEAGGYEPRFFIGGEETVLALDLASRGWQLVYAPSLEVHHHPSQLRDSGTRNALLARNAIWAAWLRLPVGLACAETLETLPRLFHAGGWRGCMEFARGMAWVLRERRVVPAAVAHDLALLRRNRSAAAH